MDQAPPPVGLRQLFGELHQGLLAQLSQPQSYTKEHSLLRYFPCEQAVGSYLQFFEMLRLTLAPEKAPRSSPENVAYQLGTMSSAVARLCATTNESRVSLFYVVADMETREQQLLQSRAQLRHTLKTLHNFMASRITGEAATRRSSTRTCSVT